MTKKLLIIITSAILTTTAFSADATKGMSVKNGNVLVGTVNDDGTNKLQVVGDVTVKGNITSSGIISGAVLKYNNTDINSNQALSNIAYLDKVNTFSQSINGNLMGNASTATNLNNIAPVLAIATESNEINITAPTYNVDLPVKLLNFKWYGDIWSLGNIRSANAKSNGFGIFYNNTEKARVSSNGNLLLGTTTDVGYKTHIVGAKNGTFSALYLANKDSTLGSSVSLDFSVRNNSTASVAASIEAKREGANDETGLLFKTYDGTNNLERLVIKNNGNVLIGNPSDTGEKLQVNGGIRLTSSNSLNIKHLYEGEDTILKNSNGNGVLILGGHHSSTDAYSNSIYTADSSPDLRFASTRTAGIRGSLSYTDNMTIAGATGNVLIGTPSDTGEKLQVKGDSNLNGVIIGAGNEINTTNTAGVYINYRNGNGTTTEFRNTNIWNGKGDSSLGGKPIATFDGTNNVVNVNNMVVSSLAGTGSRIVSSDTNGKLGTMLIEYASNSSETTSDDLTTSLISNNSSGCQGIMGKTSLSTISSDHITKRVKFTVAAKVTDMIFLEYFNGIVWTPIYSNGYGSMGYVSQGAITYGISFNPITTTEFDVFFGKYVQPTGATYASPGREWSTLIGTSKWRLTKISIGG